MTNREVYERDYEELEQYREIGTVEECREAVEKQKPKKRIYPKTALERYYHAPECPNCKRELNPQICGYTLPQAIGIYSYCPWCGQNLEGGEEMGYEDCVDGCEEYDEEWQESEDNIMMDAVKYLKERERMCNSYNNMCDGGGFGKVPKCNRTEEDNPEKAVEIVEKWSSEHPAKTRQSEILKIIPDATIKNGILITKPCEVNEKIMDRCKEYEYCRDCRKEYWLAEVE